jgi:ketosteroid isomerase-like protein
MDKVDVVRACFESYARQDRDRAEQVIGEPFVFTSPQDDHIDRDAYFERCFPTMERLRRHQLLHVVPADGDDVFVLYEYELATGEVFRNTEVLTVRDGKVVEAQVFFGGCVAG